MQWHWQFYDKYALFPLRSDELFLSKGWLPIFNSIQILEIARLKLQIEIECEIAKSKSNFYYGIVVTLQTNS